MSENKKTKKQKNEIKLKRFEVYPPIGGPPIFGGICGKPAIPFNDTISDTVTSEQNKKTHSIGRMKRAHQVADQSCRAAAKVKQ